MIEKIAGEIVILLADGRLLTGIAQHPAIPLHALRQSAKFGDEFVLEAVVGKERGNADRVERLPRSASNTTGHVEARLCGGRSSRRRLTIAPPISGTRRRAATTLKARKRLLRFA